VATIVTAIRMSLLFCYFTVGVVNETLLCYFNLFAIDHQRLLPITEPHCARLRFLIHTIMW